MKRFFLLLLVIPQLAYSQYRSKYFSPSLEEEYGSKAMHCSISNDSVIELGIRNSISTLSLSGTVDLGDEKDSFVRVLLVDSNQYEYLVYETYPLLADERVVAFSNTALETIGLESVVPVQLRIEMKKATLRIDSLYYQSSREKQFDMAESSSVLLHQAQYVAERLNANLVRRNMTWRAGVTPLSVMTYEEKKDMFDGAVPQLYGLEYYKSGVFVMPDSEATDGQMLQYNASNSYVKEWDWRNRHGKNWMTPAKNQYNCSSCWIFSTVGALEAFINLYFNRLINYDLSEQQIVSCSGYGCSGANPNNALCYIRENGIVTEECFGYVADTVPCSNKCASPQDVVHITSYDSLYRNYGIINVLEEDLKRELFRCPIITGPYSWYHSMVLTGYKSLCHGDILRLASYTDSIVVDSVLHHDLIGKTAWLMKSSWGPEWGENGFGYVIDNRGFYDNPWRIKGSVYSTLYNDDDIVCEDSDDDGYYFWGIGPKPASCPSWVPDEPDGDDSRPLFGPIDEFGNLQAVQFVDSIINSYVTLSSSLLPVHYRFNIVNGGTLIIGDTTDLHSLGYIAVGNGGTLVIDGGVVKNAELNLSPGGTLIMRNNGKIVMKKNLSFFAPVGAIVNIESGNIE